MHSHAEIAAIIPEDGVKHVYPDITVEHFSNWASLILSCQHVKESEWHKLHLSTLMVRQLIEAYSLWVVTGKIRPSIMEDLADFFPTKTVQGIATKELFAGKEWFLRLDFCSAKDGRRGTQPICTLEHVLTALSTSKRAISALERVTSPLKDNAAELSLAPARLFLVPYNDRMDPAREYRVFCPPMKGRVTAISQYRWFDPFYVRNMDDVKKTAGRIWEAALRLHRKILAYAEEVLSASVMEKLRVEGFVFDIFEGTDDRVQLIEINPFGAMSGCGSCLFHWVEDARVIYGDQEVGEVRIAM